MKLPLITLAATALLGAGAVPAAAKVITGTESADTLRGTEQPLSPVINLAAYEAAAHGRNTLT